MFAVVVVGIKTNNRAEMELPNKRKRVSNSNLSEMTKFRGSYIVKFPSTQSAKDEPQKQVQVPVSGQSFERENNGRKPRTLSV